MKENKIIKPLSFVQKKIIQVSTKKFAKNGYQKTSLNEISDAAKISKGTLFYHYPSKEELFFVVLSKSIDEAFKEEFEFYTKQNLKLFQKKENLFEDLKKYYDSRMSKPKLVERLWLEGIIESEHNSKLRQMLITKDNEISTTMSKMLKSARKQIGILEGFSDAEMVDISKGLAALFRGIFLDKICGKDPKEIKTVWVKTVHMIYNSKK